MPRGFPMNLKAFYDRELDILYFAKEGHEEEVVEISPGVNLEFGASGELLSVEILNASSLMKGVIETLRAKALAACHKVNVERRTTDRSFLFCQ
jgi:uncharacterized protein YuzE